MGERYFVRASEGAPEKGPYTIEAIKKSHERQMLKDDAIARAEDGTETQTLAKLLGVGVVAPRDAAHAKMVSEFAQQDAESAARREQSAGSSQMLIGVASIAAGVVLTAVTYSAASGGGRYVVFSGLVVFGIAQLIRGAARR